MKILMVAAAILMALGVADRLREQRRALSDAEHRAQTDAPDVPFDHVTPSVDVRYS